MSGYFETLDRLKPRLDAPVTRVTETSTSELSESLADQAVGSNPREAARSLVLENEQTDKTYLVAPVSSAALEAESFLTRLRGRLVGAETANSNGQVWTAGDLAFGLPSVVGGPLNWLHQERTIIGALTDAELVHERAARQAAGLDQPFIEAGSVVWSFLYPTESRAIASAAQSGQLYYSMECISRQVQCFGPSGCGAMMSYPDALHRTERACAHIRERAAARRLVDPIFQGAAVIVPPVKPGWANAHAEVVRRAAAQLETSESFASFTSGNEVLAAQILAFVSQGAG